MASATASLLVFVARNTNWSCLEASDDQHSRLLMLSSHIRNFLEDCVET